MLSNNQLEGLSKQIEEYGKVSLEYAKWMSIQKSSKILSTLAVLMLILFWGTPCTSIYDHRIRILARYLSRFYTPRIYNCSNDFYTHYLAYNPI
jgi:hypothetical protein